MGCYGNRTANGRFEINGITYQLATNGVVVNSPAHLYGGDNGYNKVVW